MCECVCVVSVRGGVCVRRLVARGARVNAYTHPQPPKPLLPTHPQGAGSPPLAPGERVRPGERAPPPSRFMAAMESSRASAHAHLARGSTLLKVSSKGKPLLVRVGVEGVPLGGVESWPVRSTLRRSLNRSRTSSLRAHHGGTHHPPYPPSTAACVPRIGRRFHVLAVAAVTAARCG